MAPRYEMHVKRAGDGGVRGSCPFSQRAFMFYLITNKEEDITMVPEDLVHKGENLLKLNPAGTVPVLIDHGANDKVIPDSGDICKYLDVPEKDLRVDYKGPALEATCSLFSKFATFMKNQNSGESQKLRETFVANLQELENYLNSDDSKPHKFLIADHLCEIDCTLLPRINAMKVAACHFKGIDLCRYPAIMQYLRNGQSTPEWQKTSPTDKDIIDGWIHHNAKIEKPTCS